MKTKYYKILLDITIFSLIKYVFTCDYSPTTNCSCGVSRYNPDQIGRIRDGEVINEFAMPWMAAIFQADNFLGGASIINDKFLLSAARCFYATDPETGDELYYFGNLVLTAYLGTSSINSAELPKRDSVSINQVIMHNEYSARRRGVNDIAILAMEFSLTKYKDSIWPVCLPPRFLTFEGVIAQTAGWGSSDLRPTERPWSVGSEALRIANNVTILRSIDCRGYFHFYNPTKRMCGLHGGKIPCDKDIGGPLVFKDKSDQYILIGIMSYTEECGNEVPSLYTRVNGYLDWIYDNTRIGNYCRRGPINKIETKSCICGLTLASRALGKEKDLEGRIWRGKPTIDAEFPWVVAIGYGSNTYLGTGSLISDHYALTTASTMYTKSMITGVIDVDNRGVQSAIYVLVGSTNFPYTTGIYSTRNMSISEFIYHPKYDGNILLGYDIMLMKLKEALQKYAYNILPICLPEIKSSYEGTEVTVAGFGGRGDDDFDFLKNLQLKTKMEVHSSSECAKERPNFLPNLLMCSSGYKTGACPGDNGSPLMYRANKYQYVLVGLQSYGDCGLSNLTTVATRITEHLKWIRNQTDDAFLCENELP